MGSRDGAVVRADRIAAGGDAIARRPDGGVMFVTGAIPGETVRVEIERHRRDYSNAVTVEVLDPSPDRVAAPCRYRHRSPACGGCEWQHIAPERQRALKVELVADALRRIGKLDPDHVAATVAAGPGLPTERFRTTLRLAVAADGTPGFRAARSHDLVAVDDCLVAHPGLSELLPLVRVPGAEELVVRIGARTGERSARWDGPGRPHGFPPDVALGDAAVVHELIGAVRLRVSAPSFFQSSPEAAEALVATVLDMVSSVPGDGPVVDAYGGVGLFASALEPQRPVTLVELASSSAEDARHNLAGRPATVVTTAVEDWDPAPAELVIADPARRGLGPAAASVLGATGCSTLVLVSCDAAAGARDAMLLAQAGFGHQRSVVLDPFPHTAHVEVVSLFTR